MIDDPNTPDSGSGLDVGLNRPVKFKNGIKKKQFLSDEVHWNTGTLNCLCIFYKYFPL